MKMHQFVPALFALIVASQTSFASDWTCTYKQEVVKASVNEFTQILRLEFEREESVEGTAIRRISRDGKSIEYELYYGGIQLYSYFLTLFPAAKDRAEFRFCWNCAIYNCTPQE